MSDAITYNCDAARATLTLNRPETHNRLSVADLSLLETLLERADTEPGVRIVVLTAAPSPVFCAGFEIDAILDTDWNDNQFTRTVERLEGMSRPTICSIGGAIYGGACELAIACDLRVGTPEIVLQIPPARLGLAYFPSGLRRFVEKLGPGPTKRLFLTAERVTGTDLVQMGFLDYLVSEDGLMANTDALAERIAALAPSAVQKMKKSIDGIARGTLEEKQALAAAIQSFGSAESREGIAAFREKRMPKFDDI